MLRYIYACLVMAFLITAVPAAAQKGEQFTDPVDLNDRMVSVTVNLEKLGAEWAEKLTELSKSSLNFEELKPIRIRITEYVDREIIAIGAVKDLKGSYELRTATINFLKHEKEMIMKGFVPLEKLNSKSTEAEMNKITAVLDEEAKKEEGYLNSLRIAQAEYAKRNGFAIESEEAQK
jgi:hypothetical protein